MRELFQHRHWPPKPTGVLRDAATDQQPRCSAVRAVEERDLSQEHSHIWNGMAESTLVGLPFQESKEQLGAVTAAAAHGQ